MKTSAPYSLSGHFEEAYISLREKEGRLYTDQQLAALPFIEKDHPYFMEWETRRASCKKLLAHLQKKGNALNILEVGCGNGWLSRQLAGITKGQVTGMDINRTELEQGRRVFGGVKNLYFIDADIRRIELGDSKFDIIVFAASIQYFPSLKEVVDAALKHLIPGGELHIMDSHFYPLDEVANAKQRTCDYFASMAFEVLSSYYHHHAIKELDSYNFSFLRDPYSWKYKWSLAKNPFHWVVIKHTL